MTIWDSFTGKRTSASRKDDASPTSHTELLADNAVSSSASSTGQQPEIYSTLQVQNASSLLSDAGIIDPSQLHPLAGLDASNLDYLTLDESQLSDLPGAQSALPSRGWTDDLCYGTGITYMSALGMGGAWGLMEGVRRTQPTAPPKIKLNSILNSVTRRGPFLGNSAGVLALAYNLTNSYIGYLRGKHDAANSIVAGALSGALFKSSRGLRPMMISSSLVAGAAGLWTVTRKLLF